MNVICLNSVVGKDYQTTSHSRIKIGKFLIFEGCNSCNYSYKCKEFMKDKNKNKDFRIKEISVEYEL